MTFDSAKPFSLGAWLVEPDLNRLSHGDKQVHLEPKTMQVLAFLCQRPGEVISADAIIAEVWDNRPMGDNPVYKSVAKLRRALNNDAGHTEYIQTVPKKGYRLVAPIDTHTPTTIPNKIGNADEVTRRRFSRIAWPILFGIAVGVLLAASLFWRPVTSPPQLVGLSTFSGSHEQPSFAPDGERIAFVSKSSGYSHIWTLSPGQTSPTQITFGDYNDRRPRWSPTGETILFGRRNSIWSIPATGGEAVELVRDAYNPNWSHDGDEIVFERRYKIWLADAGGNRQRPLTVAPEQELPLTPRWPAFSPDGARIVFFNPTTTPAGDLWTIGTDNTGLQQLTFANTFGGAPVWSPDGDSVVYASERNGNRNLWRVNVTMQTEEALIVSSSDDDFPEYSADGSRLIYSNRRERYILQVTDTMNGSSEILFESRLLMLGPELSSDGKTIAFFAEYPAGGVQIYTLPLVGGEPRAITSNTDAMHALPHWSHDMRSLYFYFTGEGDSFSVVDAVEGQRKAIADGWNWDVANGAKVNPAETEIIYSRLIGQSPVQTLIRNIASGEDTTFYATLEYPRWSKNGEYVTGALHVDQRFPGDIAVCPVAGPSCQILAEGGRIPVWSMDNQSIYFVRGFGVSQEIFVVPVDGSTPERHVMTMEPLSPLGPFYQVTADHRIIWVEHDLQKSELWIADL